MLLGSGGIGMLDGHDIDVDGKDANFYLYGPDADALYGAVIAVLRRHAITANGAATLQYGAVNNPDARNEKIMISGIH